MSCSEWAVCENLLFPVLDEVAESYGRYLTIWSHVSLYHGDTMLGTPDYLIAKRSPLSIRSYGYAVSHDHARPNEMISTWAGASAWQPCTLRNR